jgi:4-hydroxy-tetrahydrodipicolinate synthase
MMSIAADGSEPLGAVPIVPIPFTLEERIDENVLRAFIEHAVDAGLHAVCLPAYGSEFYKLSDDERGRVVRIAVEQARKRILVIAQSNHGSARMAAELARKNAAAGADMISIAVPRQFAIPEPDLLNYLSTVLDAVDLPFLVQDFNPGGPTVQPKFVVELREQCPNLKYLKLEEPAMAAKIRAIHQATDGQVEVLEGWGGMYVLELVPVGICGLMPGLALADILHRVFCLRRAGDSARAFGIFERLLPQIVFSLQNMELYLYCEKRLLRARGLLTNELRRRPAYTPDADSVRYVDELNERILETLGELKPPATALFGNASGQDG